MVSDFLSAAASKPSNQFDVVAPFDDDDDGSSASFSEEDDDFDSITFLAAAGEEEFFPNFVFFFFFSLSSLMGEREGFARQSVVVGEQRLLLLVRW